MKLMQTPEPSNHATIKEERERIQREYLRRDLAGHVQTIYSYTNPAFLYHMQEREWDVLSLLRSRNIKLSNSSLLEVGCGNGHILQRFLEFGVMKATGIDLMMNRILDGKYRYPSLYLTQGDAAYLPFRNEQFDMVIQFTCLSSVLDPRTRHRIADEMIRVLKPGGIILLYDLRPLTFSSRILLRALRLPGRRAEELMAPVSCKVFPFHPTPIHPISLAEVKELFPCNLVECRRVSLDFSLSGIAARSLWLARFLSVWPVLRTNYLVLMTKSSVPNR